jgi:hypothetical protein
MSPRLGQHSAWRSATLLKRLLSLLGIKRSAIEILKLLLEERPFLRINWSASLMRVWPNRRQLRIECRERGLSGAEGVFWLYGFNRTNEFAESAIRT